MRFELHAPATRSKLIMERTRTAIHNSALDVNAFGLRVAEKYLATVPVLDRVTKFVAVDGNVNAMARAKVRNGEQAMRYIKGDIKFPCDLEEAWIDALPDPWRRDLIRELAQRVGLLGARNTDLSPAEHLASLADVLADSGRTAQALAPIFADGRVTREDAPHCQRALVEIARAIADLTSLQAQVQGALVTTLRSAG